MKFRSSFRRLSSYMQTKISLFEASEKDKAANCCCCCRCQIAHKPLSLSSPRPRQHAHKAWIRYDFYVLVVLRKFSAKAFELLRGKYRWWWVAFHHENKGGNEHNTFMNTLPLWIQLTKQENCAPKMGLIRRRILSTKRFRGDFYHSRETS